MTSWYNHLLEWFSQATFFDLIVFFIFAVFIARGVMVGFIRQIAFIIAMVGGFVIAGYFHKDFYNLILPFLANHSSIAFLLAYMILFVVIYFFILFLGIGLRKVMTITLLGWFDRLMGGGFGFVKGLFMASLIFMFLNGVLSPDNRFLHHSQSEKFLHESGDILVLLVRDTNMRDGFYPRLPAIKTQPPAPVERMEKGDEALNTEESDDALQEAAESMQQGLKDALLSVPAGQDIGGNTK